MTYTISVGNPTNHLYWQKQVSNEELVQVKEYCNGPKTIDLFSALVTVVRTDNLGNFAKDFFLPTVFNYALRVEETAYKIIATFGAVILDLITLPIRMITAYHRINSNHKKEESPLYQYLQANNVDRRILESNHVIVKFVTEERVYDFGTRAMGEGVYIHYEPGWIGTDEKMPVNFIELPAYEGSGSSSKGGYSSTSGPFGQSYNSWEGYVLV